MSSAPYDEGKGKAKAKGQKVDQAAQRDQEVTRSPHEDDMYIRSLTSILSIIFGDTSIPGLPELNVSHNVTDRKERTFLKFARKFSMLLVRNHEICAIVPVKLRDGLRGAIYQQSALSSEEWGSQENLATEAEAEVADSQIEDKDNQNDLFITQNTTSQSEPYSVLSKLRKIEDNAFAFVLDFDTQIEQRGLFSFLRDHWTMTFTQHVTFFQHLCQRIYDSNKENMDFCEEDLYLYVTLESIAKTYRRFHRCRPDNRLPHFSETMKKAFAISMPFKIGSPNPYQNIESREFQFLCELDTLNNEGSLNLAGLQELLLIIGSDHQDKAHIVIEDASVDLFEKHLGTVYISLIDKAKSVVDWLASQRYGPSQSSQSQQTPEKPSAEAMETIQGATATVYSFLHILREVAWNSQLFSNFLQRKEDSLRKAEKLAASTNKDDLGHQADKIISEEPNTNFDYDSLVGDLSSISETEQEYNLLPDAEFSQSKDKVSLQIRQWLRLCTSYITYMYDLTKYLKHLQRASSSSDKSGKIIDLDVLEGPAPRESKNMMDTEVVLGTALIRTHSAIDFEQASDLIRTVAQSGFQKEMFPCFPDLLISPAATKSGTSASTQEPERGSTVSEDLSRKLWPQLPFSKQKSARSQQFRGSRHCEAILTSLLTTKIKHDKNITMTCDEVDFVHEGVLEKLSSASLVFGVSKRCCYCCNLLIQLLADEIESILPRETLVTEPFKIMDAHKKIYPYCIPEGLSKTVRSKFIESLEKLLVQNLEKLHLQNSKQRIKTVGTRDSQALSSGSEPPRRTIRVGFKRSWPPSK